MKVLINCNDSFFSYGLEKIIYGYFDGNVQFIKDLTLDNIIDADLIFASAINGTGILCHTVLQNYAKKKIICVIDGLDLLSSKHRHKCLNNMEFVSKKSNVAVVVNIIQKNIINSYRKSPKTNVDHCGSCVYYDLPPLHKKIAALHLDGYDLLDISNSLNFPYKYIAAHRYKMMRDLNLNNKMQLLSFFRWFLINEKT